MSSEFKYYGLPAEERDKLLNLLRRRLEGLKDVLFAYVHGSFVEKPQFRDLDIALWIKDPRRAFYYTVDFSAALEVDFKLPIDIHVLNEAPLPFKYRIFRRGKLLFSKDEKLRTRLIDETFRTYWDLKVMIRKTYRKTPHWSPL